MSESTGSAAPFYLDCDTGIDDALAIGLLLASPEVDLLGIGTVSGNVDAATAARNTLDLLALAGREDVPVAVGEHHFRAREYDGGAPHVHGSNGLGGIVVPSSGLTPGAEDAADLLIRLVHEHPGELRVVTIGPLTNVAIAAERDPAIAGLVHSVTVMGGAALVPGNITPAAEANIANDPEAAAVVLAADWPVMLVPLDVTVENIFEEADRGRLLDSASPLPRVLGGMLDLYFDFYVETYGRRASALHDPLAAALALGLVSVTNAPAVPIVVDTTDGPGRGQTIADLRGQRQGPVDRPGVRTRIVLGTDPPLAPLLIERLLTL